MPQFSLNDQQLAFMETFGYLHFPGLLKDCIDTIVEEFEKVWQRHGGGHDGKPHDGTSRSCIVPFIDQSEYLSALLDDDRIDGIFQSLLGEDYQYLGSDGNYYVGDSGWHSDGGWPRPIRYYKLALYLDPLTRDTGALRVIPGSHKYGDDYAETLQRDLGRCCREAWGITGDTVPAVALETEPGDVVVFNQGLKHSAWGGSDRRRMFTMNCTCHHTPEQLPLMREEISNLARFWVDTVYGDTMVRTAGPQRRRHLAQALANQDHLCELSAKHKREYVEPSRG